MREIALKAAAAQEDTGQRGQEEAAKVHAESASGGSSQGAQSQNIALTSGLLRVETRVSIDGGP
jgi:hypothetical protein